MIYKAWNNWNRWRRRTILLFTKRIRSVLYFHYSLTCPIHFKMALLTLLSFSNEYNISMIFYYYIYFIFQSKPSLPLIHFTFGILYNPDFLIYSKTRLFVLETLVLFAFSYIHEVELNYSYVCIGVCMYVWSSKCEIYFYVCQSIFILGTVFKHQALGQCYHPLTLSSLSLPLSSSSTTSRELLSQFSTCSRWKWFDVGDKLKKITMYS